MIRMKKFITSAYGISSIEKLKDVVFSFDEFTDLEDSEFDFQDKDITEFIDKFLETISTNKKLNSIVINDKKLIFDACVIFKNRQFDQLKQFTLITNDDIFLKPSTLQDLPLFITSLQAITHLQLSFNKTDFPMFLLQQMGISVGKLKQLQKLNLSFKFSKKYTDEVLIEFCQHLRNLENLEELFLDLDCTNIGNQGLIELGKTISQMHKINKLFINVQRNPQINETGSTQYFNYLLSHPKCYKFSTQMIFQFENQEENPNFKAVTNFQVQVKALTQSKKASFSSINSQMFINKATPQIASRMMLFHSAYLQELYFKKPIIIKQQNLYYLSRLMRLIKR